MPEEPFVVARHNMYSGKIMSMKDVAAKIGVSYWYVRALHAGHEKTTVPFPDADTRIGRSPLWKSDTIEKWMEERNNLK